MPTDTARKQLARRLARSFDDPTVFPALQFLSGEGALVVGGPRGADLMGEDFAALLGKSSRGVPKVAIWEQTEPGGDFVRSKDHVHVWRFCADVERIPAKSEGKRIVYVGESVARGYFYDPLYCPAKVLEAILRSAGMQAEVVDLAASNSSSAYQTAVAELAAEHLKPDAIVVFAGNNWTWVAGPLAAMSAETYARAELTTADHGWSELLELQRQRVRASTEAAVSKLAETAARIGVPLVFVVPEINLKDFLTTTDGMLDLPLLSSEDTSAWMSAYSDASESLQKGDFAAAERAVAKAVAIDGGTSSASLDLLARAQLEQGKDAEAASSYRRSREASALLRGGHPSIVPAVREALLSSAKRAGATIVDLEQLLAERHPGVPDKRSFLDYCHLKADAIKTAMSATASCLLRSLNGRSVPAAELFGHAPTPSDEQEAWAHLLAGVHNNTSGQSVDVCTYHFGRALALHPPIAETLQTLHTAFSSGVPLAMNTAFAPLIQNRIGATYLLGYLLHFNLGRFGNAYPMLTALRRTLPRLEEAPLDPEFTLGPTEEIDLLGSQFLGAKLVRRSHNSRFRRFFSTAYEPVQNLSFVSDSARDFSLFVSACVPGALESGDLVVELNGKVIGRVEVDRDWRKSTVRAPGSGVTSGLNRLTLRWPNVRREDRRPLLRSSLEAGRTVDTLTQFGWLGALTISRAR